MSIQANELRIGNLVKCLFNEGAITELHANSATVKLLSGKIDIDVYDHLHPIPLTPELLEKCGFVQDNGAWWTLNIPLPEGYTYPGGYFHFTYCSNILGIEFYGGRGVSLEEAVDILKGEKERGRNITASSFQLDIETQIWPPISVSSLHQLQNLYFALTGTELQINL